MQRLANRVVSPAQLTFGLTLAQAERLHRFRHVTPPLATMERLGRFPQQGRHRFRQVHFATSASGRLALYGFPNVRIIFPCSPKSSVRSSGSPNPTSKSCASITGAGSRSPGWSLIAAMLSGDGGGGAGAGIGGGDSD